MPSNEKKHNSTSIYYDGTLLLNSRSIIEGWTNFVAVNRDAPMSLRELEQNLEFLEMCATCKGLCFDATIPDADKNLTTCVGDAINQALSKYNSGLRLSLEPRSPQMQVRYKAVKDAASCSSVLLSSAMAEPEKYTEGALPINDSSLLTEQIERATQKTEEERMQFSADILSGKEAYFRGAKFLAGLCDFSNRDLLDSLGNALKNLDDERQATLLSSCINIFRSQLLYVWASLAGSAYYPVGIFTKLAIHYEISFWEAIAEYIKEKRKDANGIYAGETDVLPLIGIDALMSVDIREAKGKPSILLAYALEEAQRYNFQSYCRNIVWSRCEVTDPSLQQLPDAIREKRQKVIGQLNDPSLQSTGTARIGLSDLLATIIGGGIGGATGGAPGAALGGLGGLLTLSGPKLYRRLLCRIKDRGYLSILYRLQNLDQPTWSQFADRVKLIWGRELVP